MKEIILSHAAKYPLMRPEDFAKLCHQSVFGVAHFAGGDCIHYLEKEFDSVEKNRGFEKYAVIGGGFVRVNLQPMDKAVLPALSDCFSRTSAIICGNENELLTALSEVASLVADNPELFAFTEDDYAAFICKYKSYGCPAISHSAAYREAYRPAYRVIRGEYLPLLGYARS